ncbi:MAG: hypothetical protein ACI9DS_002890, partial [Glaciecola sp.]
YAMGHYVKIVLFSVIGVVATIIAIYYGSFYIMPSVTVINHSGAKINLFEISLPNSNLDFGPIEMGHKNTLHYSLSQADGVYRYRFITHDSVSLNGECGYLTQHEINKRVSITVTPNEVVCD